MSIEVMEQALAALETCRIRSVSEWEVSDVTPKNVTAAISALRTALSQQPDNTSCKSVQKRLEAQQPATGEPVGYMNEGHIHELAMRRLPYGYVYPEAGAGASTAVYTHPAPSVPDAAIDSAIYNQCPDFDNWHEGPSIDDIKAIVRAAMLHNP